MYNAKLPRVLRSDYILRNIMSFKKNLESKTYIVCRYFDHKTPGDSGSLERIAVTQSVLKTRVLEKGTIMRTLK